MAIKRPLLGEEKRTGDGDAETKSDVLLLQLPQDIIPVTMSALLFQWLNCASLDEAGGASCDMIALIC